MGPMPIEDKKDKIYSKLNTLYYKVINPKDRKAFLDQIDKEFNKQAKNYKDLLKDDVVKDFYNEKKNELADRYEKEKNREIHEDIKIVDNKLNSKYKIALKSENEEEFKKNYDSFKDEILKDYGEGIKKEEIKKYYEDWITSKIEEFKYEKDKEKKDYISNFLSNTYNELNSISTSESDLKSGIEEKKKNDAALIEYLNNNDYNNYYNKNLRDKLIIFKRELKNRVSINRPKIEEKFQKFFRDEYNDVLKKSKNENEVELNYKNKIEKYVDIKNLYESNKDYYNILLKERKESFKIDKQKEEKKEITEIENEFLKFFNSNFETICEQSSNEDEFRTKFELKRKEKANLEKYFQEGHSKEYLDLLTENSQKFKKNLAEKKLNTENIIKNKYTKFLSENFTDVADESKNETELESNYIKKINENNDEILKNNFKNYEAHFKQELESKKKQFKTVIKKRIETAYYQLFPTAIGMSAKESDVKFNLKQLLEKDKTGDFKKLLEIEEYKNYFDSLHNDTKIKTDFKNKESIEKRSLNLDTINFFSSNFDEIKKSSKNKKEFENNIKKLASQEIKKSDNFESLLKSYTEKFEEYNEKEKEKKMKQEKLTEYKEQETKLINDFMNNIDIKKFEDTGSITYFKSFDQSKFDKIIEELFEYEKFDTKIEDKIDSYIIELLNDKNTKVNHLNILLCGNSGAGKSTLINGFLELEGDNKLSTGTGEAVTMETKYATSPKYPIFRLGDSRGTEISRNGPGAYGIGEVVKNMNEFIQSQLETKNPDNYVHCIWYCVIPLDGRFNKVIDECLQEMENNYKVKGVPIIIVGTKSVSKEDSESLAKYLKDQNIKYPFHPVLARKKDDIEAFGLEELRLLSLEKAIDGIESSCYQGIIKNITETSKLKVEEQKNVIDGIVNQKKEKVFKDIESNPNFNILKKYMTETFIIILKQFSSINLSNQNKKNEEIKFGENSTKAIDKFINDYYVFCKNYYEQNYEKIISSRTSELIDKIKKEKTEFIESNLVFVESKSKEELKGEIEKKIKDKLKEKSDIYYFKNLYNVLVELSVETFQMYFINYFNDTIKDKEGEEKTKKLIITKIAEQFKELKSKIEEYNKNKKEDNTKSQGYKNFRAKKKQK